MRAIDIDTLEWFQIKCVGLDEPMILIRKPHILELDIIEAEPVVHGEWERMDEYCNHSREFRCTACKQSVFYDYFTRFCEYDYCPNCGAKMDGGQSNVP